MTPGNSHHNPHFHVNGFVVLHILSDMGPHLGRSVVWMDGIPVCVLYPRLVRHFPCIHKTSCEMCVNPSMVTNHRITTLTSLGMAW